MVITTHGGHNRYVTGANGYLNEVEEDRKVNMYFRDGMRKLGHTVYDCTDNKGETQNQNLANIVKKCNSHKAKYGFSFHLNSFNGKARGVEVCVYDSRSKKLAEKICREISNTLNIPNRGVKYRPELYVVRETNDLMFLVECCFCDNRDDAKKWNAKKCADAVIKAVTGKRAKFSKPTTYYKKCAKNEYSLVEALASVGGSVSFYARTKIALKNGIKVYTGSAKQNTYLLNKLKDGKLKK